MKGIATYLSADINIYTDYLVRKSSSIVCIMHGILLLKINVIHETQHLFFLLISIRFTMQHSNIIFAESYLNMTVAHERYLPAQKGIIILKRSLYILLAYKCIPPFEIYFALDNI